MKRRGRPPHPDVLTPREWDVLTLVREGLSNPEIAERLGVSRDAVKYHVSGILSKLHLSSREEAAAWQPEPTERPVLRPAWASALAPLAALWRRLSWPLAARIAGGAVVAAAVAGIVLLVWGVVQSDEETDRYGQVQATATADPSETADPGASPTPQGIVPVRLSVGDAIGVPEGIALIIETGCFNCDGPTSGFQRVYLDGDGSYVSEPLYSPEKLGLAEENADGLPLTILYFAASPDASDIVIQVGYGYTLGPPPTMSYLFRSRDGGQTWAPYGELGAGEFMVRSISGGRLIIGNFTPPPDTTKPPDPSQAAHVVLPPYPFHTYPDGEEIAAPDRANRYWSPTFLPTGEVAWVTDGGQIIDSYDKAVVTVPGTIFSGGSFPQPAASAVAWYESQGGQPEPYRLTLFEDGERGKTFEFPSFFLPGPWLDGETFLANVQFTEPVGPTPTGGIHALNYYPSLVDLESGTISPLLQPFADTEGLFNGRNHVVAAFIGPLVRVTGTGSCLNLRAEPSPEAEVLDCIVDGVLVRMVDSPDDGPEWMNVTTPAGLSGWASTEYLEVIAK